MCPRGRYLHLRSTWALEGGPGVSERGTCASERDISASARGTFVSKKAFRVRSTKFVPHKMFCASRPRCQDATLSDTLLWKEGRTRHYHTGWRQMRRLMHRCKHAQHQAVFAALSLVVLRCSFCNQLCDLMSWEAASANNFLYWVVVLNLIKYLCAQVHST